MSQKTKERLEAKQLASNWIGSMGECLISTDAQATLTGGEELPTLSVYGAQGIGPFYCFGG